MDELTKIVVANKQIPPVIKHEPDGRITGHFEYARGLIPDGKVITGELKADGITFAILGPVVSSSLSNRNCIIEGRFKIRDDSTLSEFPKPKSEPLEP